MDMNIGSSSLLHVNSPRTQGRNSCPISRLDLCHYFGEDDNVNSQAFRDFSRKLQQAAQDGWLLRNDPRVRRVIWYGTEPLPTTGRASELTRLLAENNIEYVVVRVPR